MQGRTRYVAGSGCGPFLEEPINFHLLLIHRTSFKPGRSSNTKEDSTIMKVVVEEDKVDQTLELLIIALN